MFESAESNRLRMYAHRLLGESTQVKLLKTHYGAFAEFCSGTAYFGSPGESPEAALESVYENWHRYYKLKLSMYGELK